MRAVHRLHRLRGIGATLAASFAVMGAHASGAASLPDIDAVVSHETRQVMASGVTRVDTWKERLVRRGDDVWIERVRPALVHEHRVEHHAEPQQETSPEHIGHRHFNGDASARWLRREADGTILLRFVDREHRAVVAIPRAEFGTVGFDGGFDGAASIVPETVALAMRASGPQARGAQWRVDRRDGWSHRVLWSGEHHLALKLESQRDDGTITRIVSVRLTPRPAALPWTDLGEYAQKRYDDFMD